MKQRLLTILFVLCSGAGYAQYYNTGQDPASIRWRQIRTPEYQLIFPESFEKKAQYLANILDLVAPAETATLKAKVPRIPIVIHSESAISNGLTVWAPKRIELYPCPPQQTYAEEWLEQLVIHEYRHVVQISMINRGFSKALYYIFGEQITGGILGLYVPAWFLEGDATVTETALSATGRGRSAIFESVLRAQIVEKGAYSFDKATLGSYKTFTPDAYSLGYYLVAQARIRYGAQVWNEALDRVAKYPFMVVPFNSGTRKATGLWKTQLYRQSLEDLRIAWKSQLETVKHNPVRTITKRDPRNFTIYNHPLLYNDSVIIAEKVSMDDVTRFIQINRFTGAETRLLTPGYHIDGTTSIGGEWLVWSEYDPHRRWQNLSFAQIRMFNIKTGKLHELTRRTRYFAPVISSDGTKVATVYMSPDNMCSVEILEVPSGRVIRSYPIPRGAVALTPNWSSDSRKIVLTLLTAEGETIAEMDTASGSINPLIPFDYNEFNGPAWYFHQYIFYSVDYSGVENIYALDTLSKAIFKVTSAKFAGYDPDFTSDRRFMIYSDYTSDGAMVVETLVDTSTWIPIGEVNDRALKLAETLSAQEKNNIQDSVLRRRICKMNSLPVYDLAKDTIVATLYPVKKYSKIGHLFNIHSWAPVSIDASNLQLKPGVMVLSQNVLNSMTASAGWEYDLNEEAGKFYAGLQYEGLYPIFGLQFNIGNRATFYTGDDGAKHRFTWQETNLKFQVGIPWNFSHGRWLRYVEPDFGTTLIGVKHNASTPGQFNSGVIQTLDYRITASQLQRSNDKDVYPRIGQVLDINYRNTPFGANDMGSIFSAAVSLYLPGFIRHQGIWLYAGYQQRRETGDLNYSYSDLIRLPRGWSGIYDTDLLSLQFNYKFPMIYPDLSLGSVIYLKRIKLNLFYDLAHGWYGPSSANPADLVVNNYQSIGSELTFDFHLLRFVAPFEMGIRPLYFPADGNWGWQFIYALNL